MTLTNRLTLFYLLTLGLVLAACAGSAYGLMRTILLRQLSERANGTLDTLVAAAEIEPHGLDWEPEARKPLITGAGEEPDWAVFDGMGHRIDSSKTAASALAEFAAPEADMQQSRSDVIWAGQSFWVIRRTIRHPRPDAFDSKAHAEKTLYRTLVFVTAWPLAPVYETLRVLLWCTLGGAVIVWLAAAGAGRWLSRRALAPVTRMATAVQGITINDLGERLPLPNPRDELHELAASFNGLLTRLQESFERQNRFTGEASHQLRTPLSVMLGQIEVALRRAREPDEYRQVLGTAHLQAERLRGIVEALLFLARADAEAGLPHAEPLELTGWLTQHFEVWESHPRRADLQIQNALAKPLWVRAHRVLLEQSVDNLIDNACKYSAPGTAVLLTLSQNGAAVSLSVEDRGCGISEEDSKHVFEPFFRSAEARRLGTSGLGLGLAVTARTVAAFGGRIEVASKPGYGSRFSIHLPLIEAPLAEERSAPAHECELGQGGEKTESVTAGRGSPFRAQPLTEATAAE